ncbi:MAG: MBL fold metallo-hydrolase [Clostridia bacterium]|nr:MBL fold metallo-hydrolase [Clostridia bacterium]MBR4658419.1 MBL fold metallo-hydrolase [Clostridia bacterium]MBR6108291.1 MBL fold metallo-hydrolase [Clostridia bacterium]
MNIRSIPTGPLAVNTYIVWNEGSNECVVIDPANSGKIVRALNEMGLTLKAILITHGHFDHIMGVAKLKEATGAKVYINRLDSKAMNDDGVNLASMVGFRVDPAQVDVFVEDNMTFTEAGIEFRVIHTPGHTKGGVCYIVESERVIFSGDTLFYMSYGRTDLPGGDAAALHDSIVYRLFTLHGDYRVLPGHEMETTLDFERIHNMCIMNGICE